MRNVLRALVIAVVLHGSLLAPARAGVSTQGVNLNGDNLNGVNLNGVNLNGVNLNGVNLNGEQLSGTSLEGWRWNSTYGWWEYRRAKDYYIYTSGTMYGPYSGSLVGATMSGTLSNGDTASLKIVAIKSDTSSNTMPSHSSNSDVVLYKIKMRADNGYWYYVCPGDHYGTFLEGTWDEPYSSWSSGGFTYACTTGVLTKCARSWGYKPWRDLTDSGGRTHSMRNFHNACVRAAMADYCFTGDSFTADGTSVDMWDNFGFNSPLSEYASNGMYSFESLFYYGYRVGDYLSRPRYEDVTAMGGCVASGDPFDVPDFQWDYLSNEPAWRNRSQAYAEGRVNLAVSTSTYCSHSPCTTGSKLAYDCNACTRNVCDDDPFCCNNNWDWICAAEATGDYGYARQCSTSQMCASPTP